ncbi:MAG: carboxymuconolactone decarboxylase family protein [Arenicellales bacterium]
MKQRVDFHKTADATRAMLGVQKIVNESGLEKSLLELVEMRASQINGCAFCLDMHSKEARARGETEQRLYLLDAWTETPLYSDRERAALAWVEAVTRVAESRVPDDVYEAARAEFSDQEMVYLTLAIVAINGWNRLCIAFRIQPGTYQPSIPQQE